MDKQEKENWKIIKEKLEESGKTDSFFYKRAKAISEGLPDPFNELK